MTNLRRVEFAAEHQAANRHDSAIGREIGTVQSDLEHLAMEWGDSGELLDSALHNIQIGLDRLRMHGTILAKVAELREETAKIERLIDDLAGDRWEGATDRTQRKLAHHMEIIRDCAESVPGVA